MEKNKELYEKVAKDTNLQAKFAEIMMESNEGALSEEEMDSVAGGELSDSKPRLSTSGKGCPIRLSTPGCPEQKCGLTDR